MTVYILVCTKLTYNNKRKTVCFKNIPAKRDQKIQRLEST